MNNYESTNNNEKLNQKTEKPDSQYIDSAGKVIFTISIIIGVIAGVAIGLSGENMVGAGLGVFIGIVFLGFIVFAILYGISVVAKNGEETNKKLDKLLGEKK